MNKRRYENEDDDESFGEESQYEDDELTFERIRRHREPYRQPKGLRNGEPQRRPRKPDRRHESAHFGGRSIQH